MCQQVYLVVVEFLYIVCCLIVTFLRPYCSYHLFWETDKINEDTQDETGDVPSPSSNSSGVIVPFDNTEADVSSQESINQD